MFLFRAPYKAALVSHSGDCCDLQIASMQFTSSSAYKKAFLYKYKEVIYNTNKQAAHICVKCICALQNYMKEIADTKLSAFVGCIENLQWIGLLSM